MKQMPKQLREVSAVRCVGFADAVRDLGTHAYCGVEREYTTVQVRKVLTGAHKSLTLLKLIAEKRPDLFGLRYVCDEVKAWYEEYQQAEVELDADERRIRYHEATHRED